MSQRMEEQGPFDHVLQSEPVRRRDTAAVAVVALAIVLGVIVLILVLPPVSIFHDDEPAVTGDIVVKMRDELPQAPEGYEAVSALFDLTGPGSVNGQPRVTVDLSTRVLQSEVLSLFTYRGDEWQRLGDATAVADGQAASAEVPVLPDNIAVMRTASTARLVAGILPAGAELDPEAAGNLAVLHPAGLTPAPDGTIAGDRPSVSVEGVAISPLISGASPNQAQAVEDILASAETREAHVQAIRDLAREGSYAGIDVDYRAMDPARGGDFTAFVRDLSTALHEDRRSLALTLPLPVRANESWDTLGFDWQALGSLVDTIEIAPVDPDVYQQRVEEAMGFLSAQVSASKLLLPLMTLSRERSPEGTRTLPLAEALRIAAAPTVNAEGSIASGATVHVLGQNLASDTGASGVAWDRGANAVVFRYTGRGGEHTVWLANRFSEGFRLDLARRRQAGGAVIEDVSLGAADAGIWPVVAQYASSGEVKLSTPNGTMLQPRWTGTGGALSSDAGAAIDWTAPNDAGAQTLTLIVSDGVLRVGQELELQVSDAAAP